MFDLIAQGGQDLVQIVSETTAAVKVYKFARQQYDHLKGFIGEKQIENTAKLSENVEKKLQNVDVNRKTAPSPSVLTPLLEAAIQESREELQDLWAALLANAMIDNGKKVRRDFIIVLSKLEPADAIVLRSISRPLPSERAVIPNARYHFNTEMRIAAGLTDDDWAVSVAKLGELGCLAGWNIGYEPSLTPFGRKLLSACEVQ